MDKIINPYDLYLKLDEDELYFKNVNGETLHDLAWNYSQITNQYIKDMLERLYTYLIDFIYFDNQNEYIGYSINRLSRNLYSIIYDTIGYDDKQFKTIREDYKYYIDTAISLLSMKKDGEDKLFIKMGEDNYRTLKESIINNSELEIDKVIDPSILYSTLIKYSKKEIYINN